MESVCGSVPGGAEAGELAPPAEEYEFAVRFE
jgi:hypothetical protein